MEQQRHVVAQLVIGIARVKCSVCQADRQISRVTTQKSGHTSEFMLGRRCSFCGSTEYRVLKLNMQ